MTGQGVTAATAISSTPRLRPVVPETLLPTYQTVYAGLPTDQAKQDLFQLARLGVLTQTEQPDDPTVLETLAAIGQTPTAPGLSTQTTVAETVRLLAHPHDVRQPLAKPDAMAWQAFLQLPTNGLNHWEMNDYKVADPHTCAAAAEISRLASQHPAQLARLAWEITRPGTTATQTVTPKAFGLDSDKALAQTLTSHNIPGQPLGPGQWQVRLPAANGALARAINAQRHPHRFTSTGVEVLLQSAIMTSATRQTYDMGVDQRESVAPLQEAITASPSLSDADKQVWSERLRQEGNPWQTAAQFVEWLPTQPGIDPAEQGRLTLEARNTHSVGLKESEEALLQTLLEGSQGPPLASVTCQVLTDDPTRPGLMNLVGYTQPFETTTANLLDTLQQGKEVIVGLSMADKTGTVRANHVVKVAGYQIDPTTQALSFLVADSDDAHAQLMPKLARDFVPLIHHLTLPADKAAADWQAIRANGHAYYKPTPEDKQWFNPVPLSAVPYPPDQLLPGETPEQYWASTARAS
jgi:hypothetical protein